ncbi:formate dehydrogenase accessory sulfurtransferase FdhD [Aquibacillus koreensis]|uniref:Sulfur carrier protein FdhD n=1 Tax=Aquibacillus koreensis TaxID=279446 RepID=A0A9X3WJF0_9BACI|nr:formate dehydrogenase accessory sulfurtransferase FdhD [Aquibacillus koreensis]MCT2537815.1 formate dehydrogenase accessory sulfurtransferase FdhD [Aquibacillus koreensis]MDC3421152.1 formate dehydrogenase accessory sulfurtransferase FdhD [Aquibacillus koreensis]
MVQHMSLRQPVMRYENKELVEIDDEIVLEFPITIHVNGEEFATMVCTPTHLDELIIGFLASEGLIFFKDDITDLQIDEHAGHAHVNLKSKAPTNQQFYSKRLIGSCCGKSRQFYFQNDARTAKTSMSTSKIHAEACIQLMNQLQDNSIVFKHTGGVHNAALCTTSNLIVDRADIGRHNALDKIYGYCMMNKIPARNNVIVFSGRISSEVLLKAAKIGVGIVLSKSAPTDLAIELADDLNITTVGFIRGESFNVYSHPERIINT